MTHSGLRLTPSNSPFFKTSSNNGSPRSPTRKPQEEPGLRLKKVVGTTTSSSNGFDALPSARCFSYTAGAAAVVATVDEADLKIRQRFFRARPAATGAVADSVSSWAASPSPLPPKHRALGSLRESSNFGSPLSSSVNGRDWSDSPNSKNSTAKDRVKAATSVALSPNGKWLAVGETGYKPRILIFSLAEGSSDTPVASLCEHMYGVHCLRFSPDSKYLASLGTVNDGFLYVWTINDRTGAADLFASNKLTTLINCITWMGRSLLTVGLRFVKVWRPDDAHNHDVKMSDSSNLLTPRHRDSSRLSDFGRSIFTPKHKTLHGKNSLLNELLECNFITALAVSTTKAIICADLGEVCVLDDAGKTQNISLVGITDFNITAARTRNGHSLEVLGAAGQSKLIPLANIASAFDLVQSSRRQTLSPMRTPSHASDAITATAELKDLIVELTADRAVTVRRLLTADGTSTVQIPAHQDAILGVRTIQPQDVPTARYLTYSADGTVHFWDAEGDLVSSLQISNISQPGGELKVVAPSCDGTYLVAGDKHGVLMLVDISTQVCLRRLRAHSAEISDLSVAVIDGNELVATAGRDRVVQLFIRKDTDFEHLQTLDEHAGAVGGVLIDGLGQRLISFSTDRTVVVREALFSAEHPSRPMVFTIDRTIVLKSSPCAIALTSDDRLLVAAVDRCIARYNLRDGQCAQTFKCADNEGGESVMVSKLLHLPSLYGIPCIAVVCSADKSVRLYSEHGSLLARDWGHTEGITDLVVYGSGDPDDRQTNLVTVAADSTMFVWNTRSDNSFRASLSHQAYVSEEAAVDAKLGPPLRKVISQNELSRFSRKKSTTDESKTSSPTNVSTPARTISPQRLRKKTSRSSVMQPPRLEPSAPLQRRTSRQRSPSPPSPRSANKKRESMRRRSMATLRSKSSDNVLNNAPALPRPGSSGFGSLASSNDTLCRSLRSYRKKLVTGGDTLTPNSLKELDQELRLTIRAVNERMQGKALDEASVSKLLEQASERIVEMLDGRIKERVENEVKRKGSDGSYRMSSTHLVPRQTSFRSTGSDSDSLAGAMEAVSINGN
ncbi:hypothetical protein AMS68_002339 [Peltaster fructicola]|uniref:Uncharacterized protein n=1 Tax=Peltaster fructicola TaxID=286661 RepID=A0A6H0XPY4_9PEZI|nr:hypothetical protein AMS68_002339 [Peltaster fructicola]